MASASAKHSFSFESFNESDLVQNPQLKACGKISLDICTFYERGACPFGDECNLVHGDQCGTCHLYVLHPYDQVLCRNHMEDCQKKLSTDCAEMKCDKFCGVCLDIVMEKDPDSERLFANLQNCNHVFCWTCIEGWRNRLNVGDMMDGNPFPCPECRTVSYFAVSSAGWVEGYDKMKLLRNYLNEVLKERIKERFCYDKCVRLKQGYLEVKSSVHDAMFDSTSDSDCEPLDAFMQRKLQRANVRKRMAPEIEPTSDWTRFGEAETDERE